MNNTTHGRSQLRAWEDRKPDNFFTADTNLQYVLRRALGEAGYRTVKHNLTAFGEKAATVIDDACKIEDRVGNHPRLERFNGIGERVEQIEFHPNHDLVGRHIWESGIMALQNEPGHTVHQMALFYLLNHTADGHSCGLACTSGLIRALQQVGDVDLQAKYLPPLLESDYDRMQHGAQFLTEVQGGSDVGANAVVATEQEDGSWRLNGEKWFCSNINADQFLVMARPDGAPPGTRGLGMFLVPRTLDDGTTNGFYLRRLKDKLGTRILASAELDFRDAVAYPIGEIDAGFKNAVELVLNTSRLMNAFATMGFVRRAYIEAASYACSREAFGNAIANYPMVQEAVVDIMSELYAGVASSVALASLLDRIETGSGTDSDRATYRMLVNMNKYITGIRANESVHRAIEVLGGNGAIESFSILPRLYRDIIVLESWEGTHNVLCLQVLRDCARYRIHEAFATYLRDQLDTVTDESLQADAETVREALDTAISRLDMLTDDPNGATAQAHIRRVVDALSHVAQAASMLAEAQWELDQDLPTVKPDVVTYFVNRRLRTGYDPLYDDDYTARLQKLMMAY